MNGISSILADRIGNSVRYIDYLLTVFSVLGGLKISVFEYAMARLLYFSDNKYGYNSGFLFFKWLDCYILVVF